MDAYSRVETICISNHEKKNEVDIKKVGPQRDSTRPCASIASDPLPCSLLGCSLQMHSIEMCKTERCCYRHVRERREREGKEAACSK
jgi:hypothetical protein